MPVWPGTSKVVHGDAPVAAGCATVVCRWRPGGAPAEPRRHDGATIHDKTRTKRRVRSVLFSLYHITVMSSKKKTRQECGAGVSGSNICLKEEKKKTVKKAVPVEEPSSDDDTADRISSSAMSL